MEISPEKKGDAGSLVAEYRLCTTHCYLAPRYGQLDNFSQQPVRQVLSHLRSEAESQTLPPLLNQLEEILSACHIGSNAGSLPTTHSAKHIGLSVWNPWQHDKGNFRDRMHTCGVAALAPGGNMSPKLHR